MQSREATHPNTQRDEACPEVDAAFTGVQIAAPPEIPHGAALLVHGVFQLPEDEARVVDERPHRGLVLVVTLGAASFSVFTPFKHVVLFDDDVEDAGGLRRGHFNVRLSPGRGDLFPGEYHVTASLGERLSNPITVRVREAEAA